MMHKLVFMMSLLTSMVLAEQSCHSQDGKCEVEECVDLVANCATRAEKGDCTTNVGWMKENCPEMCGFCYALREDEQECTDAHPQCSDWANEGECLLNPGYMKTSCRKSCWVCVNEKNLQREGIDKEEIQRRKIYAAANFGEEQDLLGSEEEILDTRDLLIDMDDYARNVATKMDSPAAEACRNNAKQCAAWAATGACEDRITDMIQQCPLACQLCEHAVHYQRCSGIRNPNNEAVLATPGAVSTILKSIEDGSCEEFKPEVLGAPVSEDDPWVVLLNNFLTIQECDELLELASNLGWQRASLDKGHGKEDERTRMRTHSIPKRAVCTPGGKCDENVTYTSILKRIAQVTNAPVSHVEAIEFLSFSNLERDPLHHDFEFHDTWMPAGPRIYSMILFLSDVQDGGETGFPEMSWLAVKPRKGQALLWPNVRNSDPNQRNAETMSEGLPVLEGTKYIARVWVRMYDYNNAYDKGCA